MENRYTNIQPVVSVNATNFSYSRGILAFDTKKNIWLITMNDTNYYPTIKWLKGLAFSAKVHYHLTDDTKDGVLKQFSGLRGVNI